MESQLILGMTVFHLNKTHCTLDFAKIKLALTYYRSFNATMKWDTASLVVRQKWHWTISQNYVSCFDNGGNYEKCRHVWNRSSWAPYAVNHACHVSASASHGEPTLSCEQPHLQENVNTILLLKCLITVIFKSTLKFADMHKEYTQLHFAAQSR